MGRKYSREKLLSNLEDYKNGLLVSQGLDPKVVTDMILDDLRVAFSEEGFDVCDSVHRGIENKDRDEVNKAVQEIFDTDFLEALGIRYYLLPGDEEELLTIIVDDLLDGDEGITI